MPSVSVHGMGMTPADLPHPVSSLSSSNAGLLRCRTSSVPENWKLLKAEEVQKSKLLRGASANLAEFIWPQDERPKVPHDDFQGAEELPIIDLGELLQAAVADRAATTDHQHHHQPSSTRRDKIAKDLAKIFSEWGFVQVVNHGVKTEVIDAMQTQAKKFFDLPLEQKEKAKLTQPGGSSTNEGFGYGVDGGFFYVGRPWIDRFQCRWSPVESITELADKVYTREEAHGIDDIDAHDAAEEFR
jgi:gibberellin 20-oxidase